jgi:uncharacterized repeat protein (TIGR03803 family)
MRQTFTQQVNRPGSISRTGRFIIFFSMALALATPIFSVAQDGIVGLTSNGGSQGKGTAFYIKTNGTGFSVIRAFADYGNTPNGNLLKTDNGNFLGMTSTGGTYNGGAIFSITPSGVVTILKQLNSVTDGSTPHGELIKGTDGNYYGLNSAGGTNTYGTIFKLTPAGVYTVLKHLAYAADGTNPRGHLVQAKDGNFYGVTTAGGANGYGTIFKMTPAGVYTVLRHMNKTTDGANHYGSLVEGKDGALYGITYSGGTLGYGTIYKITTTGTFTVLHNLNGTTEGGSSQTDLVQGTDGHFYGTTYGYGTLGNGTIFKMTPTGTFTVLRQLSATTDGANPYGNLFQNSDGFLYGLNRTGGSNSSGTAFKISTSGAYTVLHSFVSATEGATPNGGFVKGNDGNLYAFTSYGGLYTGGTVIRMTTAGAVTNILNLNGSGNGNAPQESLVKGRDSAYYGLASAGGAYGFGSVFKICGGVTTTLFSFNRNVHGGSPKGSLTLANDGNFYGMTYDGGSHSAGTLFKITPAGAFTVLRNFTSGTDGGSPLGSLVQGTDGLLYGMTNSGGTGGGGTIFKSTLTGTFTVLRHLAYATDGSGPEGGLVQGTDGNFYGMTSNNGKIFKITSTGTFTVLRTLNGTADGYVPVGSLVQHTDGNFYGCNSSGGSLSGGTIFKITPSGTYTVLRHLNPTTDGKAPKGSLLKGTDGALYGMTSAGGTNNFGTIFKITTGGSYTVLRHFNMATDGGTPLGSFILATVNSGLAATAQTISTNEDVAKAITLSGSGGSPLSFNIVGGPYNGTLSGSGASRTYTPNRNFAGKDSFAFSAQIGCVASVSNFVKITVVAVADTPILAPIGNKTVVNNTTLSFTATATDGDNGQVISYSLIGAPAGATISSAGLFSWKPTATGSFTFKVRATDNGAPALFDEEQITVTVTASLAPAATAINEVPARFAASIYPNPVNDRFFIRLDEPVDELTIQLVAMNGSVVSTTVQRVTDKNNIAVNAAHLKPGMYIVRLQSASGSQSYKLLKN